MSDLPYGERVTERQLMEWTVEAARTFDWLAYHTFDSRRSARGFPDLVLARERRLIFAELKSARGRLTPEQARWLEVLSGVEIVTPEVWYPTDWMGGRIEAALR
jgi:hypothetical protein